jgi:hypothetical protein
LPRTADVDGLTRVDNSYRMPLSPELLKALDKMDDNFFDQHAAMFRNLRGYRGMGVASGASIDAFKARVKFARENGFIIYRRA